MNKRVATEEHTIILQHGFHLHLNEQEDAIAISKEGQSDTLLIQFTKEGLKLTTLAKNIIIAAKESISLQAPKIMATAAQQITLQSAGNFITDVAKDTLQQSGGLNKNVAFEHKTIATHGNIEATANDDVRIAGERLFFNCDEA